jgi:hypothetical protein
VSSLAAPRGELLHGDQDLLEAAAPPAALEGQEFPKFLLLGRERRVFPRQQQRR